MGLSTSTGLASGQPVDFILTDTHIEWQSSKTTAASEGTSANTSPNSDEKDNVIAYALDHIIALIPSAIISATTISGIEFTLLVLTPENAGAEAVLSQIPHLRDLPRPFLERFSVPDPALKRYIVPSFSSSTSSLEPNLHILISTGSGSGAAERFATRAVLPALEAALGLVLEVHFTVHTTTSADSVAVFTRDILLPRARERDRKQLVVLMSGDGGVVDILGGLYAGIAGDGKENDMFEPVAIATMPFGTGNALAWSSGIGSDATFGLSHLIRGTAVDALPAFRVRVSPGSKIVVDEGRRRVDVPDDGTIHGAVVCSWGLHASLVAESDTAEWRKKGVDRFKLVAGELLKPADGSESHRYRGKVTLIRSDGKEEVEVTVDREEHMYVLLTLVSQLEKGFTISPASKPLDGQLRLVHFGPLDAGKVMDVLTKAYQGGLHVQEDVVGYEEVVGMRILFEEAEERWRRICVDGTIVAVGEGGWIEVRKEERKVVELVHLV